MPTTVPDITEVRPVDDADRDCLLELRAVLERHHALDRFGVNLLHDHFDVAEDEVLLEVCDVEQHTLTIRPGPAAADVDGRFVATNFQFTADLAPDGSPVAANLVCKVGCFVDLKDKHKRTHDKVWG